MRLGLLINNARFADARSMPLSKFRGTISASPHPYQSSVRVFSPSTTAPLSKVNTWIPIVGGSRPTWSLSDHIPLFLSARELPTKVFLAQYFLATQLSRHAIDCQFQPEPIMLETISDQYENLRDEISERTGIGYPNERNAGISATESAVAFVAAIGATLIARELLESAWRATLDRDPPKNPSSREVQWKEALLWGVTSGALVGIARIASRRLSTSAVRSLRS